MDNSDLDDLLDYSLELERDTAAPVAPENALLEISDPQNVIDQERRTTLKVIGGGIALIVGGVMLGKRVFSEDEKPKSKKKSSKQLASSPIETEEPETATGDRTDKVAKKALEKEKPDPYKVPDFSYNTLKTLDKPDIAKSLSTAELISVGNRLSSAVLEGLKKLKHRLDLYGHANKSPIVSEILRESERIIALAIPGFKIYRQAQRTIPFYYGPVQLLNEFLAFDNRFFFISRTAINFCHIENQHQVIHPQLGVIGTELEVSNRFLRDVVNEPSGVASRDRSVCFRSKAKESAEHSKKHSHPIDKQKSLKELEYQSYESTRLHESIHLYVGAKYPKFKEEQIRRALRGDTKFTKIEELCTQAAELAKSKNFSVAFSVANQPDGPNDVYGFGGMHFRKLFYKKAKAKIKSGELVVNPFVRFSGSHQKVSAAIYSLKDLDLIRETGREMYEMGIKMIEAEEKNLK